MNRISLDWDRAHKLVDEQRRLGNDIYWDGWDIVVFRSNPNGFTDTNGAYRNGRWGVQVRVSPDSEGLWRIPTKYVKPTR